MPGLILKRKEKRIDQTCRKHSLNCQSKQFFVVWKRQSCISNFGHVFHCSLRGGRVGCVGNSARVKFASTASTRVCVCLSLKCFTCSGFGGFRFPLSLCVGNQTNITCTGHFCVTLRRVKERQYDSGKWQYLLNSNLINLSVWMVCLCIFWLGWRNLFRFRQIAMAYWLCIRPHVSAVEWNLSQTDIWTLMRKLYEQRMNDERQDNILSLSHCLWVSWPPQWVKYISSSSCTEFWSPNIISSRSYDSSSVSKSERVRLRDRQVLVESPKCFRLAKLSK